MIGLISDTHWPPGTFYDSYRKKQERAEKVFEQIQDYFRGVEFIIHAGDVGDPIILDLLNSIAPVYVVKGNRDPSYLRGVELPLYRIVEYKNKVIGVTHGSGSPKGIIERSVRPVLEKFKPDIVVFGHTHRPFLKEIDGVVYVNPGSAGDTFFTKENWVATLEISDGKVKVEFHKIHIPGRKA